VKVLIADSSSAIRSRITKLISSAKNIEVVIQASTVENTMSLQGRFEPNVYILAYDLPGGNIIETVARIHRRTSNAKVIVLSDIMHPMFSEKCLSAGADFILDRSAEFTRILDVLN
jgi:DNA-binding NarL/FixJ family response regulator